jgi:protein-tyrosine phosphatase
MEGQNTGARNDKKIKILFVCLGNICRSPLAEGVFRHHVREAGLDGVIEIDSAGTGSWHVGSPPDERMQRTALRFGISLQDQKARQFLDRDLESYDQILVMDKDNLNDVLFLDRKDTFGHKVRLFREFDPEPGDYQVPDPYYGGERGFEEVYEMVDRASKALLNRLVEEHDLTSATK